MKLWLRNLQGTDVFLALAKENQKFIQQIERSYYGVISDAIEGCFALKLEADKYQINNKIPASYASAVVQAVKMEELIINFYTTAAEQCSGLMADVPRSFNLVAKKRDSRKEKLNSLVNK